VTPDLGIAESVADPALDAPPPPPWPRRPRRALELDAKAVVRSVSRWVEDLVEDQDRMGFYEARLQRYAKYRGWLREKTSPWPGCSNVHLPLLQTAELRLNAGLHNVVMTMRPVVSAKATQAAHVEREERITNLIDTQLFVDPGPDRAERVWSDYVSMFAQDGNAVLFTPWVRDRQTITEVVYREGVPPGADPSDYLLGLFRTHFGATATVEADPASAARYRVRYVEPGRPGDPAEATVAVFLGEDDGLEWVVRREATLYDGPVALPIELDDLFVPTRCDNLQPPSGWNPKGAPRVVVRTYLALDAIRRSQQTGEYNWLDDDGLARITAEAQKRVGLETEAPTEGTAQKIQKDEIEGRAHTTPTELADLGSVSLPCWMVFDQWDVDGDGLLEDVYFLIAADASVLCEARLLREKWPATRAYRPLPEAACIPVPGRWYAIGLLELGEALQDLVKATFDQAYDAAALSKRPFFFFAANAKMPLDLVALAPGDGIPVTGDPRTAVYFPTLSQGDQSWAFQVIGLAVQAFERLLMLGDLQLGRVPTGKASALRTYGTTAALLQQGDVRADQMLLRLFGGIRQAARYFHAMNRHLLPSGKEIRRLGWDGPAAQAYETVRLEDIDVEVDFDFRPDFLLSNHEALAGAIEAMLGYVATPLAFQAGVTNPVKFYQLLRDYARARKLDYRRYLQPPTPGGGTPISAEEAISLILADRLPQGTAPAEGTQIHAKALMAFMGSDQFGLLTPAQAQLFRAYLEDLGQRAQQEALAQSAGLFQQTAGQQMGSAGQGSPTALPPMGTGVEATGQTATPALGPGNGNAP
jgi:hypothetical protein